MALKRVLGQAHYCRQRRRNFRLPGIRTASLDDFTAPWRCETARTPSVVAGLGAAETVLVSHTVCICFCPVKLPKLLRPRSPCALGVGYSRLQLLNRAIRCFKLLSYSLKLGCSLLSSLRRSPLLLLYSCQQLASLRFCVGHLGFARLLLGTHRLELRLELRVCHQSLTLRLVRLSNCLSQILHRAAQARRLSLRGCLRRLCSCKRLGFIFIPLLLRFELCVQPGGLLDMVRRLRCCCDRPLVRGLLSRRRRGRRRKRRRGRCFGQFDLGIKCSRSLCNVLRLLSSLPKGALQRSKLSFCGHLGKTKFLTRSALRT